jgi:hypothetical protein
MRSKERIASLALALFVGGFFSSVGATSMEVTPSSNLAAAIGQLKPGDTLIFRGGVYSTPINTYNFAVPSGTSSARITFLAAPGEQVILQPPSSQEFVLDLSNGNKFLVFDGIIFDAVSVIYGAVKIASRDLSQANAASNIRLIRCEVKNTGLGRPETGSPGPQGVFLGRFSDNCEFISCKVHHNGASVLFDHGFYIQSSGNLIDSCDIYSNKEFGVQLQGDGIQSGNRIIRNRIHHNGSGVYVAHENGSDVVNNLIYSNSGGSQYARRGVFIRYSSSNCRVLFNTIVGNQSYGVSNGDGEGNSPTASDIRNNILWQNGGTIQNTGTGTISNNLVTDPKFISSSDYHLQPNSPAIGAGVAIPGVTTDFDGRPRGNPPSIGAYEGVGGATNPPPPPTNVDVTQTQPPVSQPPVYQQPSNGGSQPSGPSTSQVALPFLIAGVIGAALLLGD